MNNVGIVGFHLVRDEKDPSKVLAFVWVLNYRKEPAAVVVELEWRKAGQGEFNLSEERLSLPGRFVEPGDREKKQPPRDVPGEVGHKFYLDLDEGAEAVLHARLKNHRDQFALDHEAWLVAGVARKARVLIVTPGNDVLRNFFDLEETSKVANVSYIAPADLGDAAKYLRPARAGAFDLVVFDRCAPPSEEALPLANTFFVAEVPPPWRRADLPPFRGALIRNATSAHPLMRHLGGLDEIAYSEAFRFDLRDGRAPPRVPRLLEADRETALLFALPRRSVHDLMLTFPLVNARGEWTTNWPLRLSFPVFLRNVLYQLGHVADQAAEETVQPGEVKVLRPEATPGHVEVADPGKVSHRVGRGPGGEFAYLGTERLGVYQASWPGGGRRFAVNLLDAEESNTQPRDEIKLGETEVEADRERLASYDTWKWVALCALALLLVEWAVYHRRAWLGR